MFMFQLKRHANLNSCPFFVVGRVVHITTVEISFNMNKDTTSIYRIVVNITGSSPISGNRNHLYKYRMRIHSLK